MSMSNVNAIFLSCLILFPIAAIHTANGQELLPTNNWGSYGLSNGNFKSPSSVTVDSAGNVYVADTGNNRIQKFSGNGTFITKWGEYGTANGSFSRPYGVVADSAGNVYVADTGNNRIQKFSGNGTFITNLGKYGINSGNFKSPSSVTVDSADNVYVADTGNNRVQMFSSNGTFMTKWGKYGTSNSNFKYPFALVSDSADNVYVADTGNNRIQKFSGNGTFITDWGRYGITFGNFKSPSSVTVDSAGNVYVADTGNNRIQKFSGNGTFITKWGKYGSNDQNFRFPSGVMVQSSDYAFVADTGNNRIKVFDTNNITDSVSTRPTMMSSVTQTENMSTVNLGGPNIPIPKEPNNKTSSEREKIVTPDGREVIDDKFLTYMNASYGIRIQYPQNWTIKDNYRLNPDDPYITIVSFFAPPGKNITSPREEVTVYVDTQQYRTSLEEYIQDTVLANNNTVLGDWEDIEIIKAELNSTLAERPAYKVAMTYRDQTNGGAIDRYLLDTGTVVGDKVYVISYWAQPQTYSKVLPNVQKMMDSFKILVNDTIDQDTPTSGEPRLQQSVSDSAAVT
jgi:DNA-binding beta-propeller fold protein YncE